MSRASVFLARSGYKRRRAMDAARILPLLGGLLFMLPVLGASGGTRAVGLYLFIVWAVLVLLAAGLSRLLGPPRDEPAAPPGSPIGAGPARRPAMAAGRDDGRGAGEGQGGGGA